MKENNEKGTLGWIKDKARKDGFDDLNKWNEYKRQKRQKSLDNEICHNCKKIKIEVGSRYREKDKQGKFTGYWICKICNNYWLNHGKYHNNYGSPGWFYELVENYGREFANWAWENRYKLPGNWLNSGCKTDKEYRDKKAQDAGFKNRQDREDYNARLLGYNNENNRYGWDKKKTKEYQDEMEERREFRKTKEYRDIQARKTGFKDSTDRKNHQRWESGKTVPMSEYEGCESHIGVCIGEDKIAKPVLNKIFEEVDKKKNNNPGFEYVCKNPKQEFINKYPQFKLEIGKEYKIDIKTAHFIGDYWKYRIDHNNMPDYFMPIALGIIDNVAQHLWLIHKDDIVRNVEFCRRVAIKIANRQDHLSEFKKFEITDILDNQNYQNKL